MTSLAWTRLALAVAAALLVGVIALRRDLVASVWRRFWAAEASPRALAGFRILVPLVWIGVVDPRLAATFAAFPRELLAPPPGWHNFVEIAPIGPPWVWVSYWLFVPAALAASLGIFARSSMVIMTVTGGYVLAIPQLFGKVDHNNHLVWFALLLAAAPCGEAWAVRRPRRDRAGPPGAPHRAFALPLRFAAVLISLAYFFPGFWKLWSIGIDWLGPDNLRLIMLHKWWQLGGWRPALADRWPDALMAVATSMTVTFEAAAPVLILTRRGRWLFVAAGLAFHAATSLVLRIHFWHLVAGYWGVLAPCAGRPFASCYDALPSRMPRELPVLVVGWILIAGMLVGGITRRDAWPLGIYPTFAVRPSPDLWSITIEVTTARGRVLSFTERDLSQHVSSQRARGLVQLLLIRDAHQTDRLIAYARHLRRGLVIDGSVRYRAWAERYDVRDAEPASPRERTLLAEWGEPGGR